MASEVYTGTLSTHQTSVKIHRKKGKFKSDALEHSMLYTLAETQMDTRMEGHAQS